MDYLNSGKKNKEFTVLSPSINPKPRFFIDDKFRSQILLHISKNNMDVVSPPLILAVQGPKGEGKTETIKEVCSRLQIYTIWIHGSAISGVHEKEPVFLIEDAYKEADAYRRSGKFAVILIDDIDTSVASTDAERRYTVNSQLVNGTLMKLADNPTNIGDTQTFRIPIIITGNDMTNLYAPLTRSGRMKIYTWEPDLQVKSKIVSEIFCDCINPTELHHIERFVGKFSKEPISFFKELRDDLYDDIILDLISKSGKVDFQEMSLYLKRMEIKTTLNDIIQIAEQKQKNSITDFNNTKKKNGYWS